MASSIKIKNRNYVPAADAGQAFGYTRDYVSRLAREGKIRGQRLGRQWIVDPKSLAEFAALAEEQRRERSDSVRAERYRERGEVSVPVVGARQAINRTAFTLQQLLPVHAPERALQLRAAVGALGTVLTGVMLGVMLHTQPTPNMQQARALTSGAPAAFLEVVDSAQDGIAAVSGALASLPSLPNILAANAASAFLGDLWCTTTALFGTDCAEVSTEIASGEKMEEVPAPATPPRVVSRVVTQLPAEPAATYITQVNNPVTIIREEVTHHTELVTKETHTVQTDRTFDSLESGLVGVSQQVDAQIDAQFDTIATSFTTGLLTVTGNASIAGTLTVGGFSTSADIEAPYFVAASSTATSTFAGGFAVATDGFIYDFSSGRVGIGTSSPAARLGVAGSAYVSGDLTVAGNSTVLGNSATLGGSTADTLTINSSINSNLVPDLNATRDLGSPAYYWDDAYIDNVVVNNISAASTTIAGTASDTFTLNSDNATADTEDINLIFYRGSVVPNALITWDSTIDRFDFNQPVFIQNDSSTLTNATLDLRGTAGQTAPVLSVASSTEDSLLTVTGGGRLGVGTSTPAVSLDIYGTDALRLPVGTSAQRPTGNTGFIRYNTETAQFEGYSAGAWQGLGGVIDVDQDTYITAEESSDEDFLRFYTQGSERLTVTSAGNVGIGTTTPSRALHIVGSGQVGYFGTVDDGLAFQDNSGVGEILGINSANNAYNPIQITTGGSPSMYFDTAGKIGIGDTSPAAALTVGNGDLFQVNSSGVIAAATGITSSGTINFSGLTASRLAVTDGSSNLTNTITAANLASSVTGTTGTGNLVFSASPTFTGTVNAAAATLSSTLTLSGSSANIALGSNYLSGDGDDEGVYVSSTGNVGIGTTTPKGSLDVSGTAFLAGTAANLGSGVPASLANSGQLLVGWNLSSGGGETDLIANRGAGSVGGFRFYDYSNAGTATALMTIQGAGNVGIGTDGPDRKLDILDASNPQLRLSQTDGTIYTDLQVAASTGDLTINLQPNTTAENLYLIQEGGTTGANLRVCEGSACPAVTINNGGNVLVENGYWFGNGFRIDQVAGTTTEIAVYDTAGEEVIIFDEF